MVTLNATFFVILALFLVFLWAMNRFVIRPLLTIMDQREDSVQKDRDDARELAAAASAKEREYALKLSALHQDAHVRIARAQRAAQEAHQAELESLKQREALEVREARSEARRLIKEQREHYDELAAELREAIRTNLGLEKPAS